MTNVTTAVRRLALALVSVAVLAACSSQPADTAAPPPAPAGKKPVDLTQDPEVQRQRSLEAYLAAGMASLNAKDPERARRHIRRALSIDGSSAEALNAMAMLYRYEGDRKREEHYYRKALRADSGFSKARNNYAALLYAQGRYKAAISQLERAVEDENYDQRALAFLNLGRCYLEVREYAKAESALQRSLRLNNELPDALVELADTYRRMGRIEDSRNYLAAYGNRTRHTARSLWIGIRLEAGDGGDRDRLASYEFQLQKMYPASPEYKQWQAWKAGGPLDGAAPAGARKTGKD